MEDYMLIKLKKERQKLLLKFLFSTAISLAFVIAIGLTDWIVTTKMSVMLLILLGLIIYIWPIRPKMFFYHQQIAYLMMKESQISQRQVKLSFLSQSFVRKLEKMTFKLTQDYGEFLLYYRLTKDRKEFKYNRGTLEICILIKNEFTPFADDEIVKAINQLEDNLKKQKKRFKDYVILQFRENETITNELIHETDQVVFDKQLKRHITKINVLQLKDLSVYYLASDKFSPTLHYAYALDLIKQILI